MKRLVLVALGLGVATMAAGAAFAGDAPKPPVAGPVVKMQSRPQKVGDRYSFTVLTDNADTVAGLTSHHGDRQAFTLEILGGTPTGMVVAYTQAVGDASPESSAGWKASLHAWNGVRVVYETDANGAPLHIRNLPEVETAYLAALAKEPGIDAAAVEGVKQGFAKATDLQLARNDIGNELTALAAMQLRQGFPPGFHELRPDEGVRKDGSKLEVRHSIDLKDVDAAACQATVRRVTWTDNKAVTDEMHTTLDASARVSTADGWVIDMTETDTSAKGDFNRVKTVKVHRDAAAPGCKD